MKLRLFSCAVLFGLFVSDGFVFAGDSSVELVSIKPHPAIERTHACMIVKSDAAVAGDCNDPKCASGGAAVDEALASKGMKRICKMIDAKVNRGFDVTYAVNGKQLVGWTDRDPEPELNRIGLTAFEEHSPLNPLC